MSPYFKVHTLLMHGCTHDYESASPLEVAAFIYNAETVKINHLCRMEIYVKQGGDKYSDNFSYSFTRGHRYSSNVYVVDQEIFYDIENEDIWTVNELCEWWMTNEDIREENPVFWQYIEACQDYNNGTLTRLRVPHVEQRIVHY